MNNDLNRDIEQNFAALAMRLRPLCMKTAMGMGCDEMFAEDITQDALLKMWLMRDNLHRYQSVEAFATVVTKHIVIDQKRKQHIKTIDETSFINVPLTSSPADEYEEQENDRWLQKQFANLPSKQHSILVMRQVEHRGYKEIGNILGISENSAKTLLARARKKLFKEFKKWR